ncbi:MAG: response regulator transcription factor [Anaerolineae bacterium]|nr:response regulator transcription factor [Anaerolineae bacterium]
MTKKIGVLVVDDQQSIREGTKALLAFSHDIEVMAEAANGQEALQRIEEVQPDVVLTDVRMPVMDGLETTRQIKHHWPQVKVIVLTMYATHRAEALAAGADHFLIKASMRELLENTIRSLISNRD